MQSSRRSTWETRHMLRIPDLSPKCGQGQSGAARLILGLVRGSPAGFKACLMEGRALDPGPRASGTHGSCPRRTARLLGTRVSSRPSPAPRSSLPRPSLATTRDILRVLPLLQSLASSALAGKTSKASTGSQRG